MHIYSMENQMEMSNVQLATNATHITESEYVPRCLVVQWM